jgi:hypothetical protein
MSQPRKGWLDTSIWRGSGDSRRKNSEDQKRAVSAESEKDAQETGNNRNRF